MKYQMMYFGHSGVSGYSTEEDTGGKFESSPTGKYY